jgi:hypothetical protein
VKKWYLTHERGLDGIWNYSITKSVIFELYEGKFSNFFIMYSLFFSLCCYWIFRNGPDLTIYQSTICSKKFWSYYYTYGASRTCNTVAPPTIPKSLNLEKNSMEISNISRSVFVSPSFLSFPYSGVVQGRTNSWWLWTLYWRLLCTICYLRIVTVSKSEQISEHQGFVSLIFNFLCYAPCVCSVYRSNQTAMFVSLIAFVFLNMSKIIKIFVCMSERHVG